MDIYQHLHILHLSQCHYQDLEDMNLEYYKFHRHQNHCQLFLHLHKSHILRPHNSILQNQLLKN